MKRRGLLAALLSAWVAAGQKLTSSYPEINTWITINIPEAFIDAPKCRPDDEDGNLWICENEQHKYTHALVVKYKDRTVRFTGEQIMDILEGKEGQK